MTNILLGIAATTFYLLTVLLLALRFNRPQEATHTATTDNVAIQLFPAFVGLALHALLLSKLIMSLHGLNLGFFNSLTLFAWLMVVVSIFITLNSGLRHLTIIMLPLSAVSICLVLIFPSSAKQLAHLSATLQVHIMVSVFAYCLISIAALIALLLAFQDYQLHHHQQSPLIKLLPPMQSNESLLFKTITAGFVLLTLSLLSGFLFTEDWFNHKILFACISWLVFLGLLLGRHLAGWRGATATRWTLGGCGALIIAFFGSKLVLELLL